MISWALCQWEGHKPRIFLPHLQGAEKQQQHYCTGKNCALFHFPPLCRHMKSGVVGIVHCVYFSSEKHPSPVNLCICAKHLLEKHVHLGWQWLSGPYVCLSQMHHIKKAEHLYDTANLKTALETLICNFCDWLDRKHG